MGPERDWLEPTGEPTGEGEGPLRNPGSRGDTCGEKGDWAGLLCSPWLLVEPEALTAELTATSVPVGRSSMEPDRSWEEKERDTGRGRHEVRPGDTEAKGPKESSDPDRRTLATLPEAKHGHVPLPTASSTVGELPPDLTSSMDGHENAGNGFGAQQGLIQVTPSPNRQQHGNYSPSQAL